MAGIGSGALEGIRVIDWTQFAAGPAAAMMLGALGADVIHVESLDQGDAARGNVQLYGVNCLLPGNRSVTFENWNRNKKGLAINLKKEAGIQLMYDLVRNSDVFVTNFLKSRIDQFRLDYNTLRSINPRLIYAEVNMYGQRGTDAGEPGWDVLGQARSSMMTCIGESREPPLFLNGAPADIVSAVSLSHGIVAALFARERLGVGQKVTSSQLGAVLSVTQSTALAIYLLTSEEVKLHIRAEASNPVTNTYKCRDGRWLCICAFKGSYFPRVARMIDMPELVDDVRFNTLEQRTKHNRELIKIFDDVFARRTCAEWQELARREGVPLSPINSLADIPDDPMVVANDYILEGEHPEYGRERYPGYPFELSETPLRLTLLAPAHGQHTEEILLEVCGHSWEDIGRLKDEGVI